MYSVFALKQIYCANVTVLRIDRMCYEFSSFIWTVACHMGCLIVSAEVVDNNVVGLMKFFTATDLAGDVMRHLCKFGHELPTRAKNV